jgi:3-oxo-5-alpha-steroid 4-dehydrogenase 3
LHGDVSESDASSLWKVSVALPAFLFAWVNQYRCHAHLAGLKKYSLPDEGLFRHLVSPHYTCECLLYLSLAIAAAPQGEVVNKTMLSVLLFVVVNLGLTALGTRQWYAEKFGADAVARKWNMIPFIF